MADNQTLYPGDTGTAFTAAADEIASVKYPRVKVTWGVDGTATDASASNPLPVTFSSGTVTADTELPAAAALADNTSTPTAPAVGAFNMFYDGSTWDRVRGDSTDGVLVNLGSNNDVTFGGTVTCDTELPAAAALADNTANPTTTSVGSLGMVYDGTTWDRQKGDSTDGTLVNLGSNNDVTVTSGTVTVGAALPAGNNNIGDVDVASIVPGTAATNLGKAEDAGHTSGDVGVMALGVRNDSSTVLATTDLDYAPLSLTSAGMVQVGLVMPGSVAGALGKQEDAVHNSGDVGVATWGVRNDSLSALTSTDGDYSPFSTDSLGRLFINGGSGASSLGKAEDAAHTSGDVGTMALGVRADAPAVTGGTDGDYVALGVNAQGAQWHTQTPSTVGGLTINRVISAASTNSTSVKGSAGNLYGWYITNVNAAARYVKLYNKATGPTVGSDTPVMTLAVPANGGTNVEFTNGISFATGIGLGITTGATDADTGAVAANEIIVNLLYK